ncbi:hypothetical protein AS159_01375 [Thermotoga sp. Ku-13t]|uniref:hypothetical protein n=1 Tax=Thermotoga sp. Ku-13t TaxID=1755813 RepID=UPI0013EB3F17|nr:hypothetical protein [Thermotoga sp. Ku-13t]KAF2958383.1 hypothetical protein AS159_01375 [Thermotoga sp. Ku-13t]
MLEELKQDLVELCKIISDREISDIALSALKEAARITFQMKIRDIFNFVKFVVVGSSRLMSYLRRTIKQKGWNAPGTWWKDAKEGFKKKLEQIKTIWEQMSPEQRVDTLIDFVIIVLILFLVGGGFDFEGGLPDTDLAFSVGAHRNIFTHTVLLGLTLEFTVRFLVALATESEKRGYRPRSEFLRAVLDFAKKHHGAAITGMWLGLFVHYLKDANLLARRTKPYTGITGLSMQEHQRMLASNAFASAIFGSDIVVNPMPKSNAQTN